MYKNYINGETAEGFYKKHTVINPGNEEVAGIVSMINKRQAQEALDAAQTAFESWSKLSISARELWINRLVDAIEKEKETILNILMAETGKPLPNALYDYGMLIDCLKYFIEEAKRMDGSIVSDYDNGFLNLIERKPLGVVIGYLAWNFPLLNLGYKLGPVLASGCTCILKASTKTPLSTLYIGKVAEKIGFPGGVFNLVVGEHKGEENITSYFNTSKIPKMITLIGSSEVGRQIMKESTTSVKHFSLELGGNAPVIVTKNADIEDAAMKICGLKFDNCGQICVAPNRVFVDRQIYGQFIDLAKEFTQKIVIGCAREDGAYTGPLIDEASRNRMLELIEDALLKGASLVTGGKIPEGRKKGWYLEPAIICDVTSDMRAYNEEIFGPVMPVIPYDTLKQAVRMANECEYGLASYVFTKDLNEALSLSDAIESGSVCVNQPFYAVNLPHGGIKESALARTVQGTA